MAMSQAEAMFSAPIPGESLTHSPDNPRPFEQPPEYTNVEQAQEWIFSNLTSEDNVEQLIDFIGDGIPVDMLATQIVFTGFANGKWTPDLMLLLIEPTIYILLFIAEQAGIDYILSDEDEYVDDGVRRKAKAEITRKVKQETAGSVPDMQAMINEKLGGLLSRPMEVGE